MGFSHQISWFPPGMGSQDGVGIGSDAQRSSLNAQAFMGQEEPQAQECQMPCSFGRARILAGVGGSYRGLLGLLGEMVQPERRGPGLPE